RVRMDARVPVRGEGAVGGAALRRQREGEDRSVLEPAAQKHEGVVGRMVKTARRQAGRRDDRALHHRRRRLCAQAEGRRKQDAVGRSRLVEGAGEPQCHRFAGSQRTAPRYEANRSRSANTPAAVTSRPAPGPWTTSGFSRYRPVRKSTMLSVSWTRANGWDVGYGQSPTLASPWRVTRPTNRRTLPAAAVDRRIVSSSSSCAGSAARN